METKFLVLFDKLLERNERVHEGNPLQEYMEEVCITASDRIDGQPLTRLDEELAEFKAAVLKGDVAEILDEAADVVFYVMYEAAKRGITPQAVIEYGTFKLMSRRLYGKNKVGEAPILYAFAEEADSRDLDVAA